MKCPNCGTEFNEGIFCPECGTKVTGGNPEVTPEQKAIDEEKLTAEAEIAKNKAEQARLEKEKAEAEAQLAKEKAEIAKIEREKAAEAAKKEKEKEMRLKAEQVAAEKAAKKAAAIPKRRATMSLIWGVIAVITCGGLIFPEILGIVNANKAKMDGEMVSPGKAGFICSIISCAILVVIGVLIITNNKAG